MTKFTLDYQENDGWLVGRLVEIPGVFSQGETLEELKKNIKDAYQLMLQSNSMDIVPADKNRTVVELGS